MVAAWRVKVRDTCESGLVAGVAGVGGHFRMHCVFYNKDSLGALRRKACSAVKCRQGMWKPPDLSMQDAPR